MDSHNFELSNVKVMCNTFELIKIKNVWFSETKMNPLLFWVVVYLLKENLNRITLATEVFTSSINRIERRLTVMQDDLTLLRRLEQIENMDIDDWNHSLFILVTYICQHIENSNIEKSWRYFSFWFSRMVVYFVFDITQLYLQILVEQLSRFSNFL